MSKPVDLDGGRFPFDGHNLTLQQVCLAYEVGHKPVVWRIVQLARCADLGDGRVAHDYDFVGNSQRFFLIVSDINNRQSEVLLDCADVFPHLPAEFGVEI